MEFDKNTSTNLITTLQKNLLKEEKKNKKLNKQNEILKTQNNFLDSQLEYSEKKYQKKELMIKGLKNRILKLEKQLQETQKERDNLLVEKIANASQISKEIYETGGQSTNMEIPKENCKPIKDSRQAVNHLN
jgi:predicted  nucleic acid-binding Zn-ribbon protein